MNKMFILFAILITIRLSAQQNEGWKIYTSLKSVNDITFTGSKIWGATTGGAFMFNPQDSSYTKFSKVNGLLGINLTAINHDNDGNVWFGSSNGAIDFISTSSSIAGTIPDIFNSDKSNKQINSLERSGDTIIAAHDFGITLVDSKKKLFIDTYFKFGSLISNTKVNYAVKYDRFYAANNSGVIVQKPGAVNLSYPESWIIYTTLNGLASNSVHKVQLYNGAIIAATQLGLSRFNGASWDNFASDLNGKDITDIHASGDSLFIISNNTDLYVYTGNALHYLYTYPAKLNKVLSSDKVYAAGVEGIYYINNNVLFTIVPNGPKANQFLKLTFDKSNTLWVASGSDRTGIGFYALKDEHWTNYNTSVTPALPNNAYFTNYTASDNSVYFGNWGAGFIRVKDNQVKVFNSQTGMKGIPNFPDFRVVTSFANDSKGNLWALNFGASDRKDLTMMKNDSTFYHFALPAISQYTNEHYNLVTDQYDTKWFSINSEALKGLFYFNENKTIENTADDKSGSVGNFSNITTVVADKRGDIWVGTGLGAYMLTNTGSIFNTNPSVRNTSIFSLRQQTINCILVDPINQKWIGTNEGLLLVNSDGSSLLAAYNTKNSPLLSDIIRSIAIDENTGRVYVATDEGIISFNTPSIKPQESFSELFVYPSPFKLNGTSRTLTIEGLIKESDIKILNITGNLIRQFSSPGGRTAYWDGKDEAGNEVGSGIYIIVAYDKEGNNVANGKVAVLKE